MNANYYVCSKWPVSVLLSFCYTFGYTPSYPLALASFQKSADTVLMSNAHANITRILKEHAIHPIVIQHPPVYTCEEADLYTPDPTAGLKSLLLETSSQAKSVCVLLGNQKVNFKALQTLIGKRVHMVPEDLACDFIGCDKGAIPPFGHAQLIPIYVDNAILTYPMVYFNPGKNTETMGIKIHDFIAILIKNRAVFFDISQAS